MKKSGANNLVKHRFAALPCQLTGIGLRQHRLIGRHALHPFRHQQPAGGEGGIDLRCKHTLLLRIQRSKNLRIVRFVVIIQLLLQTLFCLLHQQWQIIGT